jgi:PAS domain S-box-containing protein
MSDSELQSLLINQIYEASPEGILVVDAKNTIISHNHQFVEIWQIQDKYLHGLKPGTAIGLDNSQVLSSILDRVKNKQEFLTRIKALYNNPDLKDTCEIELLDGKILERNSSALISNTGQYLGRVWFFRDISERKQMEKGLRLAQFTVDWAQDAIFRIGQNARIQYVNNSACKHLGYSKDELLKLTVLDINPSFSMESWSGHWKDVTKSGWRQFETVHKRKDGSLIPVEVVANFINLEDEFIFFSFVRNISERKHSEAKLLAAKQAEESNRLRSTFLAGMSHELRTPLNAILGFAQLLEMDSASGTPEQHASVNHILIAGRQLLGLINDLLDFSQIDIGKLHVNIAPLCLAEITAICVSQIASAMAKQKDITVTNRITDTSLWIQADSLRLRQVLINLLSNAVKYNRENGQITICSRIDREGWLRIEIHDTGMGISTDKLSLLFAPFERIDQKHGTISGVGIGLHITKRLVEAMGGTVGAESEPGKGCTFWFELPLSEKTPESTVIYGETSPPQLNDESKFVVLHIEDNLVNAQLISKALQRFPRIEILIADNAEDGLTLAEENHPDLILMDINLPGMDGITATKKLKQSHTTRDIPVVALSADAYKKDIERALNSGCSDYLTKPVDLMALYEVIDRMRFAKNNL